MVAHRSHRIFNINIYKKTKKVFMKLKKHNKNIKFKKKIVLKELKLKIKNKNQLAIFISK